MTKRSGETLNLTEIVFYNALWWVYFVFGRKTSFCSLSCFLACSIVYDFVIYSNGVILFNIRMHSFNPCSKFTFIMYFFLSRTIPFSGILIFVMDEASALASYPLIFDMGFWVSACFSSENVFLVESKISDVLFLFTHFFLF